MARFSRSDPTQPTYWTDGWDGYAPARQRLLQTVVDRRVPGVVVLGGDVHAHYVADLKVDFDDARAPVVATEFCGTSIASRGAAQERVDEALRLNPHVRYGRSDRRGYVACRIDGETLHASLMVVDKPEDPASAVSVAARFVVEAARPGRASRRHSEAIRRTGCGICDGLPRRRRGPMTAVLAVTVPFFALVLSGYVAGGATCCPSRRFRGSTPSCCTSRCRACCSASA